MPSNHLILCRPLLFMSIFPSIGVFSTSQLFASGDLSTGASASASVLPVTTQNWFPLGLTGLISLLSKRLSRVLQHHNLKASVLWHSIFFMAQLSHPYLTTGKTIALTIQNFVGKVMSLLFNMLSRFVIAFLGFAGGSAGKESVCSAGNLGSIPGVGRSPGEGNSYPLQYSGVGSKELDPTDFHFHFPSKDQSFSFMTAVTICSDFRAPQNKVCHCFHGVKSCDRVPWS